MEMHADFSSDLQSGKLLESNVCMGVVYRIATESHVYFNKKSLIYTHPKHLELTSQSGQGTHQMFFLLDIQRNLS